MSFSRPGLRLFQATRAFRPTTIKSSLRQPLRQQTTTAQANAGNSQNYLQKLWRSEVGPKTVHFWAPIMKVRMPFLDELSSGGRTDPCSSGVSSLPVPLISIDLPRRCLCRRIAPSWRLV